MFLMQSELFVELQHCQCCKTAGSLARASTWWLPSKPQSPIIRLQLNDAHCNQQKHRNLPSAMFGHWRRRQTFCSSQNHGMVWWTAPGSVNSITVQISESWHWSYAAGATQTIKNIKSCPVNTVRLPKIFNKANLAKGTILQCTWQSTVQTTTKDLPCPILPSTWFTNTEIRSPLICQLFTLQTTGRANLHCIRLANFLQYHLDWNAALPPMKAS